MSSNGTDLGHIAAMLQQVILSLAKITEIQDEHTRILNQHTLQLHTLERRADDATTGMTALRQTVTAYHGSVLGHGILLSELDHRVRRIELHLDIPEPQPHA